MTINFTESSAKYFRELTVGSIFEYKDTYGRIHTLIKTAWSNEQGKHAGNAYDLIAKLMIPMNAYDEVAPLAGNLIIE